MRYEITQERFLENVAQHKVRVIRDEGTSRHLRFKDPETSAMYFDIITWDGYLCYTGDMGTYVFSRITDMLEFFRCNKPELQINCGYWSEKVQAQDRNSPVMDFDWDDFAKGIAEDLSDDDNEERHINIQEQLREMLETADHDEWGAVEFVRNFHMEDINGHDVCLWDVEPSDGKSYSFRFVWACYAIAWGIKQYDLLKETADV